MTALLKVEGTMKTNSAIYKKRSGQDLKKDLLLNRVKLYFAYNYRYSICP